MGADLALVAERLTAIVGVVVPTGGGVAGDVAGWGLPAMAELVPRAVDAGSRGRPCVRLPALFGAVDVERGYRGLSWG